MYQFKHTKIYSKNTEPQLKHACFKQTTKFAENRKNINMSTKFMIFDISEVKLDEIHTPNPFVIIKMVRNGLK